MWIFLIIAAILVALAGFHLQVGKRRMDQGTVLWTLAIATHSGFEVSDELNAIAYGLSGKQRRRVNHLSGQLRRGVPLNEALKQTPGVVPHFAVLAAQVGAQNGNLAEALRNAATFHSSRRTQQQTGSSSLTLTLFYLLAVPLLATLIITGLMVYIVPKFKEIFEGFDTKLPDLTTGVIDASDEFYGGPLWLLFLVGIPLAIIALARSYYRGWGEHNIPLVGRWCRRLDVPDLLRNLAATVSENGSLEQTLGMLAQSHRRSAVRASLVRVHARCVSGEDCWQAMHSDGLLTQRERNVIESARRVGNLPWVLSQLAESLERRFAYRWLAFLEFAQPAVVLLLGLGVAVISLAFFMPLLKLINDLS